MTDNEILQKLRPLIIEVTGADPELVRWNSGLMADLGAESLDLLDLSFLIEEQFGILLEGDAIEQQAKRRMGDVPYEHDGVLTEAGIWQLKAVIPELDSPLLASPFRKSAIPSVLTVGAFARLIQLKLSEKEGALAHAQG